MCRDLPACWCWSPLLAASQLESTSIFFNSPRIVSKVADWNSLVGGGWENGGTPLSLMKGGNGASGQARHPSVRASQSTKIEARQVWKMHALRLPLAFHDTRGTHAALESGRWKLSYPQGRRRREEMTERQKRYKERQTVERGTDENHVLVCKWTVSLDAESFLSLVPPVVN